jgi:UDP-N-acetylglucosamine--N-acetylmuramyl-(pentapeptide) pyrophosphoryl-undecaprenol N-acetylglucosamine transferase
LIVCRAGASTVTEIAAVGAAALFVPFPFAVDDHQTTNARFLSDQGAAQLIAQKDLTPEGLAALLQKAELPSLLSIGEKAKSMQKIHATEAVVKACEALTGGHTVRAQGAKL